MVGATLVVSIGLSPCGPGPGVPPPAGLLSSAPRPCGARRGGFRVPARRERKGSERRKVFAQRNPEVDPVRRESFRTGACKYASVAIVHERALTPPAERGVEARLARTLRPVAPVSEPSTSCSRSSRPRWPL